jgi:tol-pal system protein YbgF
MNLRGTRLLIAPVVLLTTGACFATRSDVRVLQSDILAFRQESARADSARARQIAMLATSLGMVNDSLRDTGHRLARFQGDTRGELRSVGEQLIRLQELVGQSQAVVQRLRAEAEERAMQQQPLAPVTPPAAGDTTPPAAGVPSTNPGPNQLFEDAMGQLRRQSYSAAQMAFSDLIRMYPTSDRAPDAQYWLAEAYDADGQVMQADSAFRAVVTNYPKSARAPTALYKMALSMAKRGRLAEARVAMERVTREYPNAAEADLATEWLRTNR